MIWHNNKLMVYMYILCVHYVVIDWDLYGNAAADLGCSYISDCGVNVKQSP